MSGDYTLSYGTHATPDDGRCAMEWVSYLAGERHSDQPVCVSPVVRAFCIALNDGLEDEPRQRLRPYLARTIGTAEDGLDSTRSWLALDWLIRVYAPAWLHRAALDEAADALAALQPVLDISSLHRALGPLADARRQAHGARSAEFVPPWAAVRTAARETAWSCAAGAAWAAARVAVGDLAGDRARADVRAMSGDAAAIVAADMLRGQRLTAGRSAAKQAAREALAPVVSQLRGSVFSLLEAMLPTERVEIPELPSRESRVAGLASSAGRWHAGAVPS